MENTNYIPHKTTWAMLLMAIAYLIQLVTSILSRVIVGDVTDPAQALNLQTSTPMMILGCLSPISLLLILVAVILVMTERKNLPAPHPRLALLGLFVFILVAVAYLGLSMPMSFFSTRSGNEGQAMLGLWGNLLGTILTMIYPVLMFFGVAKLPQRVMLVLAGLLGVIGSGGIAIQNMAYFEMKSMQISGLTMYYAASSLDTTSALYRGLSAGSVAASGLFFLAFLWLAVIYFRQIGQAVDDRVI
ncbi:MAG: hypothetical protein JW987_15365 [Anaerolineaceae bacterium]|nr:hypothetical protein [Anaerolineaceae bacterium]